MAQPAGKRSTMSLYANINDPYSHRVRIVLAEKGISAEVIEVSPTDLPEGLFNTTLMALFLLLLIAISCFTKQILLPNI